MQAKKYKSELISILNPFEGIYTIEFKSIGKRFKYYSGQFLHLAIDEDYDGVDQWPDSRCFSMQSNPNEETIRITYAVKGSFTKLMEKSLKPGSKVWLKLPYGDLFQQEHDKANTVFIAGGTGITPYLSLFNHITFEEYTNPKVYLGFRSENYNIYQKELNNLYNSNSLVQYVYQDTVGTLDINKIFEENGPTANYFISGPPIMIKSFKQALIEKKVPNENVLTDDWE
ncbi:MAG: FAD-dependent oxidoreductase [Candidatus Atribacteria bacterium]|nr:FAD-dependent oxidoreductase [Candidatus Atribacteria bacterium]